MVDREVIAVVLSCIIIGGAFATSQTFFPRQVIRPFSALGLLGPKMKIGDYPSQLIVGECFTLYVYVENHEGKVMYYAVLVKLGNMTTLISNENPMDVPVVARSEVILLNGRNWTSPITLSMKEPGIDYRLVFELWIYDQDFHDFIYYGRWCQLWLNVTRSATL